MPIAYLLVLSSSVRKEGAGRGSTHADRCRREGVKMAVFPDVLYGRPLTAAVKLLDELNTHVTMFMTESY